MIHQAQVNVPTGQTKRIQLQAEAQPVLVVASRAPTFDCDRSFIIPEQAASLLASISAYANQFSDRRILVVGHTDAVGSDDYNQRLSERRGMSAFAHLTGDVAVWNVCMTRKTRPTRSGATAKPGTCCATLKTAPAIPTLRERPMRERTGIQRRHRPLPGRQ